MRKKKTLLPLCLLADSIALAANIGGLFRLSDALGVEKLWLTGSSPVPPNRRITKTSRSTEKTVDFSYHPDASGLVRSLKAADYSIVSLELTTHSIPLSEFCQRDFAKICLILGAENRGISTPLLTASDHCVMIPMRGANSSMNVTTACAIAVFAISQRLQHY